MEEMLIVIGRKLEVERTVEVERNEMEVFSTFGMLCCTSVVLYN